MEAGVRRFPVTRQATKYSFLIPAFLLFLWVYPLYLVPTAILGERSYSEMVLIHSAILVLQVSVFFTLLWAVSKRLGKAEEFWPVVTMINCSSIAGFVLMVPLFAMVMTGHHSWEEVFNALLLVSFYELALTSYIITRGMKVPWQFGTGLAFLGMFVYHAASATVFTLIGVQ